MLKALTLIASTLLLIGAGVGAGVFISRGSDAPTTPTTDGAPAAATLNLPEKLAMHADDGTGCTLDIQGGAAECTAPDGARQTVYRAGDAIHVHTGGDGDDGECLVLPLPSGADAADAGSAAGDDMADLIRPGTTSKRVDSWVISVPEALRGDDAEAVTEFEYFQRDGDAWKIEFFANAEDKEPTVLHLGASDAEVPAAAAAECTDVAVAPAAAQGRKLMGLAIFGPGLAAGFGAAGFAVVFVVMIVIVVSDDCRRRRRRLRGGADDLRRALMASVDVGVVESHLQRLAAGVTVDGIATAAAAAATAAAAAATTQLAQIEA